MLSRFFGRKHINEHQNRNFNKTQLPMTYNSHNILTYPLQSSTGPKSYHLHNFPTSPIWLTFQTTVHPLPYPVSCRKWSLVFFSNKKYLVRPSILRSPTKRLNNWFYWGKSPLPKMTRLILRFPGLHFYLKRAVAMQLVTVAPEA